MVLGSTAALPAYYQAYIVDNTTQLAAYFSPVVTQPGPIPSPNTTPSFANPVYQQSGNTVGTFPAGGSITVYLNNGNNQNCVPSTALGTFTLQ